MIVYVAVNPSLKSSLSGALTWMTRAGDFRYVRASISTELPFDQMIASVAHELQHAVEVIEDESVIDERVAHRVLSSASASRAAPPAPLGMGDRRRAAHAASQVRRELVAVPTTTWRRASD